MTNKGKRVIFPTVTLAHQFVITKGGWTHFDDFFQPYRLSTAVGRFVDLEDFFNSMFKKRARCVGKAHQFHFLEDLIRNEFNLDEQEIRKEKWIAFKKDLDFIHHFDSNYDPLVSFHPFEEKIKFLVVYFEDLMQNLKEKKDVVMKSNPEKDKLVLSKPACAKVIPSSEYIMHKRLKYSVLMSIRDEPSTSKGKRAIENVLEVQDSPQR